MRRAGDIMSALAPNAFQALEVRVRGRVQGVGFRPTLWRMARELRPRRRSPQRRRGRAAAGRRRSLAYRRVSRRHRARAAAAGAHRRDRDAGLCRRAFRRIPHRRKSAAAAEQRPRSPPMPSFARLALPNCATATNRHYRYPFTSCTHCGPRLSIVRASPTIGPRRPWRLLLLCPDCGAEYRRSERSALSCRSHCLSKLRPERGVDRAERRRAAR